MSVSSVPINVEPNDGTNVEDANDDILIDDTMNVEETINIVEREDHQVKHNKSHHSLRSSKAEALRFTA